MTRRNFLKKSIGGGALLVAAVPVASQTSESLRLLSADTTSAEALKLRIEVATDGGMPIELSSVEDASTLLAAVANGEADMALAPLHRFVDQNLAFGMFDSMPFGLGAGELEGWISASDGREMLDLISGEFGTTCFLVKDDGVLPMWSRAPIADASSMSGLKIGSRGLGIQSLQAMGVTAVSDLNDASVSWSDLDVLDGVTVVEMQARGLTDTFPHLTNVNPNTPTCLSVLIVNNAKLDEMLDSARIVLQRACSAEFLTSRSKAFHDNATALSAAGDALSSYDLPDDVWTGLNTAAQSVLKDIFDSGQAQASIVDAYIYYLTDIAGWSEIGEAAYYSGRKRLAAL